MDLPRNQYLVTHIMGVQIYQESDTYMYIMYELQYAASANAVLSRYCNVFVGSNGMYLN